MRLINHALALAIAFVAALLSPAAALAQQGRADPLVAAAAARLGTDAAAIDDLITANRILAREGILDAYGHVSVRDPRNPNRYLIARTVSAEFVTANDIEEFDLDSNPVGGDASNALIERFIHGEIYKARPDVRAIVHSHSEGVIPFSVSSVALRPVFHMAAFIADGVPVWDPDSSGDPAAKQVLVRNRALGASLAKTLGGHSAALLRGHGAVIVGANLPVAVKNSIFLNANARMQAAAIALGGSIKYISVEEARGLAAAPGDLTRAWNYWKRRALERR